MNAKHRLLGSIMITAVISLASGCGGVQAPGSPEVNKIAAPTAPAAPASPAQSSDPKSQPVSSPPASESTPVQLVTAPPSTPAPAAPPQPVQPANKALTFSTVQQGAYSNVAERTAALITSEAAWKSQSRQSTDPAPVDFSKESVLIVYMGERRTGGYSITIEDVQLKDGKLVVRAKETRPAPGAMVTMALTYPFHAVRIPAVPEGTKVEVIWE